MLGNALILTSLWGKHHNIPGYQNKLKLLVDHGAPLNATDGQGAQAIHAASIRGDSTSLHELILLGANIHAADALGRQPLHYAAMTQNLEALRFLISKGANINAKDGNGLLAVDHVSQVASLKGHTARAILQAPTEKEQRRKTQRKTKNGQRNEL
eukprot:gnl/TRDRNA2_/TRDRNA2_177874_c0_seq32.p1 gnl/TRDRNA2_/TRDRNA2_177874_c0~~gnl/TRDRNA2_/TRDRNA2_177874_c0_seq32.p1  ORF type:complete len:155 (-),score=19.38 gnl/TRDRNA2_/TRDRNA2_177874_c0_seq32:18-482(-)